MTDINKAVEQAMTTLTTNGAVQEMIENELRSTIKSIINDQLRSYSDFGKSLKEKIDKELCIDLDKVTFTEYNKIALNLIEGIMNNAITKEMEGKFKADLEELFGAPPTEIKLSEIIEKFKEESLEYDRDDAEKITLIIEEPEYSSRTIALHPKDTKGFNDKTIDSWQDCDLYMAIRIEEDQLESGKLSRTYDRSSLRPHQYMPTCMSGTSRLLYQLYCAGSTLILDQGTDPDDYDLYYNEDDNY